MTSVRRALALSLAERYLLMVVALASSMLVARLLTPEEIGLFSVTLAVVSLAQMVRDFGIGSYLIQHPNLQDSHVRTAFGIMLIVGTLLFTLFFFAGPLAAEFYNDPRISLTLRICALNFLVLPFCSISMSLLRREMRFDRIALISIGAGLLGTSTTVGLAWAGFGANGLAIGSVATNVLTGLGAWLVRRDLTVFRPSLREWRGVINFGGQSALTNLVSSASNDVNDLALGKVLGFAPVAMISRAQGLPNMFQRDLMGAVQGVALPAFARAHREGEALEPKWAAGVGAVTAFGWPFFGFAALMALELMRLLYGAQWDEAARLVPMFCLAGAVVALSNLVLHLLVAVGRIDLYTKAELSFQPLRAGAIVAVAVVFESLAACAWAVVVVSVLQLPLLYWMKSICQPFDWAALRRQLRASFIVTAATLALPTLACWHFGFARAQPMPLWVFAPLALGSCVVWLLALLLVRHPIIHDPVFGRALSTLRLGGLMRLAGAGAAPNRAP
jgi:O-antigen/teichoic acid export membrane protein